MSNIHDALKKAQKEKNAVCNSYNGVISARDAGRSIALWKWAVGVAVFLSLLGITLALWSNKENNTLSVEKEKTSAKSTGSEKDLAGKHDDAQLLYDEGLRYQKTGRAEDAKKTYLAVLRAAPDNIFAMNNLGVIYLVEGNYAEAGKLFEKAIKVNPDYVDAHYNLACFYARINKPSDGLKCLKTAIGLDAGVREWVRTDRDLMGLRGQAEYDKLIE